MQMLDAGRLLRRTLRGSARARAQLRGRGALAPPARARDCDHALTRGARVTTTSAHLARRVGHALVHAFTGDLSQNNDRGENLLRVAWRREA